MSCPYAVFPIHHTIHFHTYVLEFDESNRADQSSFDMFLAHVLYETNPRNESLRPSMTTMPSGVAEIVDETTGLKCISEPSAAAY